MVITIMTDLIEAVNFLKSFLKTVFFYNFLGKLLAFQWFRSCCILFQLQNSNILGPKDDNQRRTVFF